MASNKILIAVYEPGKLPVLRTIIEEISVIQTLVGGYLEMVQLGPKLWLGCNEDGKRKGLPVNRAFGPHDTLVGTFFLVRSKGEDFDDIVPDEDFAFVAQQFGWTDRPA